KPAKETNSKRKSPVYKKTVKKPSSHLTKNEKETLRSQLVSNASEKNSELSPKSFQVEQDFSMAGTTPSVTKKSDSKTRSVFIVTFLPPHVTTVQVPRTPWKLLNGHLITLVWKKRG